MNNGEFATFKKMFESYYNYLKDNENSLLARIYGIFTVHMEDIVPVHLILMANTTKCVTSDTIDPIECMFDLKGSLVGRVTKDKNPKKTTILKDLNIKVKKLKTNVSLLLFEELLDNPIRTLRPSPLKQHPRT
jgi:hypothetical protein